MKKVLLELNIPSWVVTTQKTLMYAWNSIKWIIKPPRCQECGARMHATHYHVWHNHKQNGTRLLVENMTGNLICPSCLIKEVNNSVPSPASIVSDHDIETTCDCCQNEDTQAYRFYETDKIKLHYCIQWWNGFHICKVCTIDALLHGIVKTGFIKQDGDVMRDIGAYGLMLNKGKVMLFRKVRW